MRDSIFQLRLQLLRKYSGLDIISFPHHGDVIYYLRLNVYFGQFSHLNAKSRTIRTRYSLS